MVVGQKVRPKIDCPVFVEGYFKPGEEGIVVTVHPKGSKYHCDVQFEGTIPVPIFGSTLKAKRVFCFHENELELV